MRVTRVFVVLLALFTSGLAVAPLVGQSPATTIVNALLIDGSGAAPRRGAVRLSGDRIVAVGDVTPPAGDRVVDAGGLALAPGFIDTHSHHDRGLATAPDAPALLSQGITTIVVGQDGGGSSTVAELFARFAASPVSVNVAAFSGHGRIRSAVMGKEDNRTATAAEVEKMKALVKADMDAGALGLSTGLEYDPGIYSDPAEVIALAKVAGDAGGRYASHIRSEDRDFWQAIDEVITIGRVNKMPVQVSHIKLGMLDLWGQADKAIAVLDKARASGVNVVADIYPYTYWQSNLGVFFPKRNFSDRAEAEFVLSHISRADGIIFNSFRRHPDYEGKTLAAVAKLRGTSDVQTLLDLLAEPGGDGVSIVARGMDDTDVARLMQWPFSNICSDGMSTGQHPRGSGSFPKVLGPYVRDKKLFPIQDAVRKMTTLAAANVGIANRGALKAGNFADLVLFDPTTVADRADFGHAQDQAVGVKTVWVNGQIVFNDGRTTKTTSGRPVKRPAPRGMVPVPPFSRSDR